MTEPVSRPDLAAPDLTPPDLAARLVTADGRPALASDIHTAPTGAGERTHPRDEGYLIRSEEQLRVSTVPVRARRVRLEKFVVTETRTVTVQVSHEEVRLVEVHLDADSTEQSETTATDSDMVDTERWMTLSEERVVVTTEVVPVERVRLGVYSVTEQRDVTDTVRREQVQFDPLIAGADLDLRSRY